MTFLLLKLLEIPLSRLSYKSLDRLGRFLGRILFYCHRPFRKKALSNVALAYQNTLSEKERKRLAIASFQHLTITTLEYFRLSKSRHKFSEFVTFDGGEEVLKELNAGRGVIFLSAHQANWEIPFLALTERFRGIAIGRPIKNTRLYDWILAIRQMHGGQIITPKSALKKGIRALQEGLFVGIVGDQALPESPYSYPLLGTRAWTTTAPALLAYRTGRPLVVGTIVRKSGRYLIHGSPLLWANQKANSKEEIVRLMNEAMGYVEKSIQKHPEQWLWQHDRWKQQEIGRLKKGFRFGQILIVLPQDPTPLLPHLPILKQIYPRSFLTFFAPSTCTEPLPEGEVRYYTHEKELFVRDFRFQCVLDLYDSAALRRHFRRLGAFKALSLKQLEKIGKGENLGETLMKALCR